MRFSFDPAVIVALVGATVLYMRAVRVLRRRGVSVGRRQQAAWHAGMALMAVALLSPVDGLGEELLSAHMAQHLLIADLAAPLLIVGLRTPLLQFYLPRPALVALARRRRARRAFAVLRLPLVAIAVYVAVLYTWHLAMLFDTAVRNDTLHALQHQSFIVASVLVWWPALEPNRRRLRGELWKIGHILGARLAGMFLGMAFAVMRTPAYPVYSDGERTWGISPLADQQSAGAMMLSLDFFVVLFALAFFFWQAAREHDRAEQVAT